MLFLKRLSDFLLSLTGIIVLLPLLLIISLLVRLTIPGPAFFAQDRVGKDRRVFRILKFRTMAAHGENAGKTAGIGNFLRRTKLDELLQLFNILAGDMSFVGPRPYILSESEGLPDGRFTMRPGLTGLAQVSGNTFLSWDERTGYDLEYVDKWSPWLDLKIILRTVKVVVLGEEACVKHKQE